MGGLMNRSNQRARPVQRVAGAIAAGLLALLLGTVAVRTALFPSHQPGLAVAGDSSEQAAGEESDQIAGDSSGQTAGAESDEATGTESNWTGDDLARAALHLSQAVQLPTVSGTGDPAAEAERFAEYRAFLEKTYPGAHRAMTREIVGGSSLLYRWEGKDASLEPILFVTHMDVVPADNPDAWTHAPFDGVIADGMVWGRGTLDDKVGGIGLFEALERLSAQGFAPERTLYLAMGHDEELTGPEGAGAMAALLESRGIRLQCVLDEGGMISEKMLPGIEGAVALLGTAEKGYATFRMTVEGKEGHSSMPDGQTAIGVLAGAIDRVGGMRMPARIDGAVAEMFEHAGPEMSLPFRTIFANRWLFDGLVKAIMSGSPADNAVIRSTAAVTMVSGGVKENMLPSEASALVNCRILPGESVALVQSRLVKAVSDERVRIEPSGTPREPSAVTSTGSAPYRTMAETVHRIFPDVVIAPTMLVGGTDSHHYAGLTDVILRFRPIRMDAEGLKLAHAVDERIPVASLGDCVRFDESLIRNLCGMDGE